MFLPYVSSFDSGSPNCGSQFFNIVDVFWKCGVIFMLMVHYVYVTFYSLQRAMHISLVNKVPLSLFLQIWSHGSESLVTHITRFKVVVN